MPIDPVATITFTMTTLDEIKPSLYTKLSLQTSDKIKSMFCSYFAIPIHKNLPFYQCSITTDSSIKGYSISSEMLKERLRSTNKLPGDLLVIGTATLLFGIYLLCEIQHARKQHDTRQQPYTLDDDNSDLKQNIYFGFELIKYVFIAAAIFIGLGVILKIKASHKTMHRLRVLETKGISSTLQAMEKAGKIKEVLGSLIEVAFNQAQPDIQAAHVFYKKTYIRQIL